MGHLPPPAEVRHPVYATRVLCEVANERGVPTADVLAGTAIEPADLDDPDAVVGALDEITAVRRLLARLPDDAGIGIDVGSRFALTHFGLFGFAVMSCGTLRELLTIAMRYFALTTMHVDITLFETADDCLVELDASHLPADVRGFFIERDIAGIIATTTSFALPLAAKYADQVSAELAVDAELLRPLLELVPVHDVAFGRAQPGALPACHVRRAVAAGRPPYVGNVYCTMRRADATQRATPWHHGLGAQQAVSRFRAFPNVYRRCWRT